MTVPLQVGQIESVKRVFSQTDFNRFAALSGDDNPIHIDPEFSAKTKFGQTVAHGMFLIRPEKQLVNLSTLCTNPVGEVVCCGDALVLVSDVESESSA